MKPRTQESKQKTASAVLDFNQEEFLALLAQARLPVSDVTFDSRKAAYHQGDELVAMLTCVEGHKLELTMREVREALDNSFFNDTAVVPHLCPVCAYPDTEHVKQKKATVYHRLAPLRKLYPKAQYVSGFDTTGKEMESYSCGNTFKDGAPHPAFHLRYDKLAAADSEGDLGHCCYICGILAGDVPKTTKTLEMFTARMHLIAELLDLRSRRGVRRVSVQLSERTVDTVSTSKTKLIFSCGQPDHPSVIRTADNYFNPAKGGYCRRCLADAELRSTTELL
jgi:hypothetical protein